MVQNTDKAGKVICVLLLSPSAGDVTPLLKQLSREVDGLIIFAAFRGREIVSLLLNELGGGRAQYYVCTYIPITDLPSGVQISGPLRFLEECRGKPVLVV